MWCATRRFGTRFDTWLVVLVSISLVAWLSLALHSSDVTLSRLCSAGLPFDSFSLAFAFYSPAQLAAGWLLMLAAMMLPLIVAPLRHVRERSFAHRRARAMCLFVTGYGAVWMIAGIVLQILALQAVALAAQLASSDALVCLALSAAAATLWQVSPAKQWCLNRCHRRPQLAAFGAAADRAAFHFGLSHGAACVGACWALMLLPLFAGHGHVLTMLAVMLFAFAERLENAAPLAWRWRGPGKALRLIAAQVNIGFTRCWSYNVRMHLAPRVGRDVT
jgi:predicted metal-binding membrane protein